MFMPLIVQIFRKRLLAEVRQQPQPSLRCQIRWRSAPLQVKQRARGDSRESLATSVVVAALIHRVKIRGGAVKSARARARHPLKSPSIAVWRKHAPQRQYK